MITICMTYFKSLRLENLRAALHSVRQQDFSEVESLVVLDNDTADDPVGIQAAIDALSFPVPVKLVSVKHNDPSRTHSWSTNAAVQEASTPWVLFTRADYLLDFDLVGKFLYVVDSKAADWDGFVTSNMYHLTADVDSCEKMEWRRFGPKVLLGLPGAVADYTIVDTGVWMARTSSFSKVGGLDESLTAWGHSQTHFQDKMHRAGVEFVRIPEVLFFHPQHNAMRDINVAHQQLQGAGLDLKRMWSRYHGVSPYSP